MEKTSLISLKKMVLGGIICVFFFQIVTLGVVEAKDEEYPKKPIQLIVGLVAGSLVDLNARAFAKVASKYLEKPLVVVNMPGAAMTVAMNELAKAPPDGHTIVLTTSAYESLTCNTQKIPFDRKLIKPLLGITKYGGFLLVRGDFPYAKFDDFIAYGRKNPGAINYGHPGRGTELHMIGMAFFRSANIVAVDVPYRGSAETQEALLGGHITSRMGQIAGGMDYIRTGRIKAVVAFTEKRVEGLPDVPTSQEKGYADLSAFIPLVGAYIHRDTPLDRFNKLHDALKKAVEDPEFAKLLGNMDLKPVYISPESYAKDVSKMEGLGIPLLKELKLFVE